VLHSAEYRNLEEFLGADVLVVGSGCSGMGIAYDLAWGGAGRVWIAVRTQPNIVLRAWGGFPTDLLLRPLFRLPLRKADATAEFWRRHVIGDLAPWGLTPPKDGVFTGIVGGKVPTVVDREVIETLRAGQIEVVAGVASVGQDGVQLVDETALRPDVIVAATGYITGLDPLVGHLGVLSASGVPHVRGGPPVQPGLRFIGYDPQIQKVGYEARRVAQQISQDLGR
jgi:Flavin-binding monooxygenase-like